MKTSSTIGSEEFEALLSWLDSDRDRAAEKYERIRQRLNKMLTCRGCWEAEELVDETIDRVARKIGEIRQGYVGEPAAYFGGVARHVHQEWLRKRPATPIDHNPQVAELVRPEAAGPEFECLDHCLDHLTSNNRELILEYYQEDKQAKINRRKVLAEHEGIEVEALRLRVHRIRKVVRDCVLKCVAAQVTANGWVGGAPSLEVQG